MIDQFSGEVFACDACIKSHRQSYCEHYERELKLVDLESDSEDDLRDTAPELQRDLANSARDTRETKFAQFIGEHALGIASRLYKLSSQGQLLQSGTFAAHLHQQIYRRARIERYLASEVSKGSQVLVDEYVEGLARNSGGFEESEDGFQIDHSSFPALTRIKKFILAGTPISNFKYNIYCLFEPDKSGKPQKWIQALADSASVGEDDTVPAGTNLASSSEDSGPAVTTVITTPDTAYDESDDGDSVASDDSAIRCIDDDRISKPREYFRKMETLERDIFEDSTYLFPENNTFKDQSQDESFLLASDLGFNFSAQFDTEMALSIIKHSKSAALLTLLECYSII